MIEYIKGELTELTPALAVVECHGIGYGINVSLNTYSAIQGKKDIKSFNYDAETGYLVYTQAEIDWWTHHIYIEHPMKVLTLENINLYKVRTFE